MAPHRTGCTCVKCRKKNILQVERKKETNTHLSIEGSLAARTIPLDQLPILNTKCILNFPRSGRVNKIFIYTLDIPQENIMTVEACVRDGFCEMQLDILDCEEANVALLRECYIICREKNIQLCWTMKIAQSQEGRKSILESGIHGTVVRLTL